MVFFKIENTLVECTLEEALSEGQFVGVLNSAEWRDKADRFDMGIEMEIQLSTINATRAEVNYDSLTGSFFIPNREDPSLPGDGFAFALDEKGVVFVDDGDTALSIINSIRRTKKWKLPSGQPRWNSRACWEWNCCAQGCSATGCMWTWRSRRIPA